MRRAFTLTEVLIALAIIVVVASIAYPIIGMARKAGLTDKCRSNLAQLGKATLIYMENEDGIEVGKPEEMGLPPHLGALSLPDMYSLRCTGWNPEGNGYYFNYPNPDFSEHRKKEWATYVAYFGQGSVLFFDPSHQDSFPRSISWDNWTVIALRIDGSIFSRTKRGFPNSLNWWIDKR